MTHYKIFKEIDVNNYPNDTKFCVIGVFDTDDICWEYYCVSYLGEITSGDFSTTEDFCTLGQFKSNNYINIAHFVTRLCLEMDSLEQAIEHIEVLKYTWESGSNNIESFKRSSKIDDIFN